MGAGVAAGVGTRNAPPNTQSAARRRAERVQRPVQKPARFGFRSNFATDSGAREQARGIQAPNARSHPTTTLGTFLEQTATRAEAGLEGGPEATLEASVEAHCQRERNGFRAMSPPIPRGSRLKI